MPKTHYYNLIPFANIPLSSSQKYTYSSENKLILGQEVEVKFSNKKTRAIVWEKIQKKPNFRILKIQKIISQIVVLNKQQKKLAEWISRYYWCPLGIILKTIAIKQSIRLLKNKKFQSLLLKKEQRTAIKINRLALQLTQPQKKAIKTITTTDNLDQKKSSAFLLFGATGSGKTEVYLRVIEKILKEEHKHTLSPAKQVIILVPEISLTPQAIERYTARFPGLIAVLHSRQNKTERFKEWLKIKLGKARIIIGPRSAIFAPIKNLGLIVLDEEHDSSFKQSDLAPRYDARAVAQKLASLHHCPIIFGSATPSINIFHYTQKNLAKSSLQNRLQKQITLLNLPQRIQKSRRIKRVTEMPSVQIIDLRHELKQGNFSIFSKILQEKIKYALLNKKQVLLFINRRGASSFVICRKCGWVDQCKRCAVPLVYHFPLYSQKIRERMICHHCGLTSIPQIQCKACKSKYIKYLGAGTQKAETEISNIFPKARIARMDRDTTKHKGSHAKIYQDFKNHKIDILIGTQMITKGWDLPAVDLVGILSADSGLHLPDFRACEKIFELLTQVAGRAGRGQTRGEVILQTYSPLHFVIQKAKEHNYLEFFEQEIKARKKLNYPPFSRLIKLVFQDPRLWYVEKEAKKLGQFLKTIITKNNLPIEVLGPAPMFINRLYNKFRWQIVLKILNKNMNLAPLLTKIPLKWKIDIDPESLL